MKVVQLGETELELTDLLEPGFEVESPDPSLQFGAIELFVASVGLCSFSVLSAYGGHAEVDPAAIQMRLNWSYDDEPLRIAALSLDIRWPGLPASRREAARRAAAQCTLHHTLADPPRIQTRVIEPDG